MTKQPARYKWNSFLHEVRGKQKIHIFQIVDTHGKEPVRRYMNILQDGTPATFKDTRKAVAEECNRLNAENRKEKHQ